jgi:sn-glycerol 3-phosphate transport system permease protein
MAVAQLDRLRKPPAAAVTAQRAPGTRHRKRFQRKESLIFWLLILPNILAILVFSYYPTLYNFVLSFMKWDMISPAPEWVGFENYVDLLTSRSFFGVLGNTLVFTGISVLGSLAGGLAIGFLLSRKLKFSGFVRTMAFAPHMLPGAAVGILWLFMFDPVYGLSRWFFDLFGAASPQWTTTSDWSIWAITLAYTWQRLGFVAIIYYTAILDLPKEIFEAASLDGASGVGMFRRITLPLLSPVTYFLSLTGMISAAQAFDIIATLTSGGPGGSSTTLSWMVYEEAFLKFDLGTSAASATILFLLLMVVTIVQHRIANKQVHYS